jgi:hypothetical protein
VNFHVLALFLFGGGGVDEVPLELTEKKAGWVPVSVWAL